MKKLVCLLALVLIFTGCSIKPVEKITDAEKFAKEYSVTKKNPFKYVTANEAITILEEGTGIIYFGFPECPWCQASVNILTEALNSKNVKEVYYFNPKEIREKNTKEYKRIIELVGYYLFEDENNNKKLFVPDVFFIQNGKIIGHNNDMSTMSGDPDEYLTDEKTEELKNKYLNLIAKLYSSECNSCN